MAVPKDLPVSVKKMFEHYLYRCGFNQSKMNPVHYIEMEKVHYAAVSTMMVILHKPEITEQEMNRILQGINCEIQDYWTKIKSDG